METIQASHMKNEREYIHTFPAKLAHLPKMLHWVRKMVKKVGFTTLEAQKVEIAAEEALVNIIKHAYKDQIGEIELSIFIKPKEFARIIIKDKGTAFNPLVQDITIDHDLPIEERKIGGLGIFFMSMYMDKLNYERKEDDNILTLQKNL